MDVNITLVSVLVIVLLFIPGFFFKRFYYSGQFTKQFNAGTFAERFITSIFWGLVVQCIAVIMCGRLTNFSYNAVRKPVANFYSELAQNKLPDCTSVNFYYGAGYVLTTILIAMILGVVLHKIVRLLRLDIYIPVLRFTNYWNYYFKGDLRYLRSAGNRAGKVISTNIDVIINDRSSSETTLYTGFLAHYTISQTTGELETIALSNAERWSKSRNAFKPIVGDSLIIPYNTVVNLNLRYNIQQLNFKQRYQMFISILAFITLPTILFAIPYHYNRTVSLFKIICAMILAIIDWLFFFTAVTYPATNQKKQDVAGVIIVSLIVVALLSFSIFAILY